jgi:hypothetical protein
MKNYQLYTVRVEKEFVVAAPIELSVDDVEKSVENIMCIHESSMRSDGLTHVFAEEFNDLGSLPAGWDPSCLPYSNYPYSRIPEDLVNKSIKELL